jgi:hypothetical protein
MRRDALTVDMSPGGGGAEALKWGHPAGGASWGTPLDGRLGGPSPSEGDPFEFPEAVFVLPEFLESHLGPQG